jgi:hypothetical protein
MLNDEAPNMKAIEKGIQVGGRREEGNDGGRREEGERKEGGRKEGGRREEGGKWEEGGRDGKEGEGGYLADTLTVAHQKATPERRLDSRRHLRSF